MITFISFCLIFAAGMLVSYIDWEKLISEALDFNKIRYPIVFDTCYIFL